LPSLISKTPIWIAFDISSFLFYLKIASVFT